MMLDRLMDMKLPVVHLFSNSDAPTSTETTSLDGQDWVIVQYLRAVLTPLKDSVKELEGDKYATIHLVLPHINALKGKAYVPSYQFDVDPARGDPAASDPVLKTAAEMGGFFPDMISVISEQLSLRFNDSEDGEEDYDPEPCLLAMLMCPKYDMLEYCDDARHDALWETARGMLRDIVTDIHHRGNATESTTATQAPVAAAQPVSPVVQQGRGLAGMLSSPDESDQAPDTGPTNNLEAHQQAILSAELSRADIQLDLFKKSRERVYRMGKSYDGTKHTILTWWLCVASLKWPLVALLARVLLAALATEANVERIFSAMGTVLSDLRLNMHPDIAEAFIFLRKNRDRLPSGKDELVQLILDIQSKDAERVANGDSSGEWPAATIRVDPRTNEPLDSDSEED